MLVKVSNGFYHRARFLRSRGVIKINQRMPMRLLAQNREVFAKSLPFDDDAGNLVHSIICYTRHDAPVHSDAIEYSCGMPTQPLVDRRHRTLPLSARLF